MAYYYQKKGVAYNLYFLLDILSSLVNMLAFFSLPDEEYPSNHPELLQLFQNPHYTLT